MTYSYLLWLAVFIWIPLILLWVWQYKLLKRNIKTLLFVALGSVLFALPWDFISIRQNIWYFTIPHIVGIWFLGIPLEEWFFIIFVSQLFATMTLIMKKK